MMDHAMFEDRLDDFVDGLLNRDERRAVERHLSGCATCRGEVESIRRLQAAAHALPRQIQPPRDLWAGIAARIEAERGTATQVDEKAKVIQVDFGRRARPAWWMRPGMLAAAAIVLIVISSAVTALLVRTGPGAVSSGIAVEGSPAGSALVAFEPAEQQIVETVEQLQFALEAQRGRLSPNTVAVVEENLRVIDRAISEARAALEADPNNRNLTFLLMDVYKQKVDLLQNAVQISNL
jgi:anti-sigma factor RsiW